MADQGRQRQQQRQGGGGGGEDGSPDVDMELDEEEGEDEGFIKLYDSGDGACDWCMPPLLDPAHTQRAYTHPASRHPSEEEGNPPGGDDAEEEQGQQGGGGREGAPDGMIRSYFEVPWYRTHHLQQQQQPPPSSSSSSSSGQQVSQPVRERESERKCVFCCWLQKRWTNRGLACADCWSSTPTAEAEQGRQ